MPNIKSILLGIILVLLITNYFSIHAFNQYKEDQHDLIQKAAIEKSRIEKEQNDKYKLAEDGYSGALSILNDRLRNAKIVSGSGCVPVASSGSSNGTVPEASTYSIGTTTTLATRKGTCESSFYADALKTTLQCQRLIDLVKSAVSQ